MTLFILQKQKEIVLKHTGPGKPSFKKFHLAIKGRKDEMEIIYAIEKLLFDPQEAQTDLWGRFIRNCLKHYEGRLNKYKIMQHKDKEKALILEISKHHETMGLIIAACSKLQSFESYSSKSIANNCSIFFMFPEGKKKLEKMMDCMTDECAKDLIESINEIIKAHNLKY
nr:hypothetical protein [uncultured Macellibacteroides sp.]